MNQLQENWSTTGPSGEEFTPSEHSYAADLNVLGEGSLFQLLCTCRTEVGRQRLADYLLHPATLNEAALRQNAVKELRPRTDLRKRINFLGKFSFQGSSWEVITTWLNAPPIPVHTAFRILAALTSSALAVTLVFGFVTSATWMSLLPLIVVLLFVNAVLGLAYRTRLLASQPAIRAVGLELLVLRQGLALLQSQTFDSVLLTGLVESAKNAAPQLRIRKLERLIGALAERDKEWFYAISRALLIGTQTFLAIERWRANYAESMRAWLAAWGEFEALTALANYAFEHPENTFPQFSKDGAVFEATGLGHPLLPLGKCVRNNVSLNQSTRFYVVSGSNMAGKSTLLRAIGLNTVLAFAGAPVCAERFLISQLSICASISLHDSLLNGKSKFLAEIDRLKQALSLPVEGSVLFLIDEILSGTNSKDRRVASEAIVRTLIQRGAIGALSTHDLALTELASLADLHGTNVHMGSIDSSDPLNFDFTLKPGVTNESSALAIARLAGVPV